MPSRTSHFIQLQLIYLAKGMQTEQVHQIPAVEWNMNDANQIPILRPHY